MKLFHGSPFLFSQFDLTGAGKGTGIKFGFGVYLTESEASAVHYSQPRGMDLMPQHYLYEVEIPDLGGWSFPLMNKGVFSSLSTPLLLWLRLLFKIELLDRNEIHITEVGFKVRFN